MSECKCRYLKYLNGTVAREVNPACKAHERATTWDVIKGVAAAVFVSGIAIMLFWGFTQTCKDPNSQECKDLMYQMEMSSD